jgi:hypothetical protein
MNYLAIPLATAALIIAIAGLCKQQSHPFYLKIEVQYGK